MAASGSGPPGRGLDISLAALRRHDPYIQGIVDVASQVALYTFSHKASEWEKTDVEGTLFVYSRSASPRHGFTIMNRLSMENRTEPITKDLDFQLQDPFLLYRNARFFIYGIWFYDKQECQRIAELMKNLTREEQVKARQSAAVELSPMSLHSDGKEVDILQMLTKAKDQYSKSCSEPKMITSSSAIHSNPNLIKPIAVKASEPAPQTSGAAHAKPRDQEPQHLSLSTLFGKPANTHDEGGNPHDASAIRPPVVRSLSYEESAQATESREKPLCPAIQKLMVRAADLHPAPKFPENQHSHNGSFHPPPGDVFSSLFLPVEDPTPAPPPDHESAGSLLHLFQGPQSSLPPPDRGLPLPLIGKPHLTFYEHSQQSQRTLATVPLMPLSSQPPPSSGAISPQELLQKLHLVRQEQQFQIPVKPTLAAKFPAVSPSATKPPWGEKHNPLVQQVISPPRIPATVSPSLLISPMVFTQSSAHSRSGDSTKHPLPANLLLPMSLPDAPSNQSGVLSKSQLQGTLLHLLQNDESFLNTVYETYLSVLARGGAAGRKF